MGRPQPAPASRPHDGVSAGDLPGLDPRWSRLVTAPDSTGVDRTWHLLDNLPLLETAGVTPTGTILCVHGNPTWSYLWRTVLAAATDDAVRDAGGRRAADATVPDAADPRPAPRPAWRVVAVDQLDMGYSERTGATRGLAQRIADLSALTETLGLTGRVVTLGHDWGGVVSLGWAVDHPDLLAGVMLLNTAVHQPENAPLPIALRLALRRSLLANSTVRTTAFLDTTLAIAHPALSPDVRRAFRAPYRTAARRTGIGAFVADIPVDASHPSFAELARVSSGVARLQVPALMLWGPRDPVFSDRYLGDLIRRLPHADVTRFEHAGHLVGEDVPVAPIIVDWLAGRFPSSAPSAGHDGVRAQRSDDASGSTTADASADASADAAAAADAAGHPAAFRALWATIDERAGDTAAAVVEMAPRGAPPTAGRLSRGRVDAGRRSASTPGTRTVSWALLKRRVDELAAGLTAVGVRPGDRVSLLVPPGADLTAVLYACLRLGAVVVVADAGLGLAGLHRAVRGARPDHVIGIESALAAARVFGWPGQKISARTLAAPLASVLGVTNSLAGLARLGRSVLTANPGTSASGPHGRSAPAPRPSAPAPCPDAPAAVLFTSGSTGPAKGVVYTHRQLAAVVELLRTEFDIGPGTGLVAGFAPFALLGPALGATSVTPAMNVTSPKTLTATAIAEAASAVDATVAFASPAALVNVLATSEGLCAADREALERLTTLLSAGAPLPVPLLQRIQRLVPAASIHTPYGMTEGLLMTDITLEQIVAAEQDAASENAPATPGGVCVGTPVSGVELLLSALDDLGRATGPLSATPGVTGEIVVSAPHLKDHYDQLWLTDREAARATPGEKRAPGMAGAEGSLHSARWHRTGDVGHLDGGGRLWVEGRLQHVITTPTGILTPVGPEQATERLESVRRAAFVGIGPAGTQQAVAVIERAAQSGRRRDKPVTLADASLTRAVRRASGVDVAAVLVVAELPTDIRHNSKIDRAALSRWAAGILAGGRRSAP